MTISNLALSAPGGSVNTLVLSDPGTSTPLRISNALTITSGGVLQISNGVVEALGTSGNSVKIDGGVLLNSPAAELIATNNLQTAVGFTGLGTVTIQSGKLLVDSLTLGLNPGSAGTLTMAGGTNQITSSLFLGGVSGLTSGTVWLTDGLLNAGSIQF